METTTEMQTTEKLILENALNDYSADQIEITAKMFMLEDGNVARFVQVYAEVEDEYGFIDRVLLEDDSYFATVVDGVVYGNCELDALVQEYPNVMVRLAS
jgi:transcription termination factor NusB